VKKQVPRAKPATRPTERYIPGKRRRSVKAGETFLACIDLRISSIFKRLEPAAYEILTAIRDGATLTDGNRKRSSRTCNPKRGPRKSRNGSKPGCRSAGSAENNCISKLEFRLEQSWRNLLSPKCTRDGRPSSAISNHWVLLCMRLYWGWQVFTSPEWGKLKNLNRTSEYFASLHIPAPHLNAVIRRHEPNALAACCCWPASRHADHAAADLCSVHRLCDRRARFAQSDLQRLG